jgi:uncharacterized protein (TIGR02284 family)
MIHGADLAVCASRKDRPQFSQITSRRPLNVQCGGNAEDREGREHKANKNDCHDAKHDRARHVCSACAAAAADISALKESLMDKYRLLLRLNDLLRTSQEGEKRFRTCAQNAQNASLKRMLESAADRCAKGAEQLRAKIRGLGGEPVSAGSVNGTIGMDDHAILAECERGQHIAKNEYEAALDEDLPLDIRAMVERQYQVVTENNGRIRNLRNAA